MPNPGMAYNNLHASSAALDPNGSSANSDACHEQNLIDVIPPRNILVLCAQVTVIRAFREL